MTMKENRPIRLEYCNKLEKKRGGEGRYFPFIFPPRYYFSSSLFILLFSPLSRYYRSDRIDRSM